MLVHSSLYFFCYLMQYVQDNSRYKAFVTYDDCVGMHMLCDFVDISKVGTIQGQTSTYNKEGSKRNGC